MAYRSWSLDRHARACPGHPRLFLLLLPKQDVDGRDEPGHDGRLDQILFCDDLAEPAVVRDEFLDEFMHAVLEDIIHIAVLKTVANAAGVALGCALAAIGDTDLIEIAHQVAVAA